MVFVDVKDLTAEVEQLRAQLEAVCEELEIERAHRNILQRAVLRLRSAQGADGSTVNTEDGSDDGVLSLDVPNSGNPHAGNPHSGNPHSGSPRSGSGSDRDGNVYVFDDEDASRAAFDEFFATPDPHLEKVRGFLLD